MMKFLKFAVISALSLSLTNMYGMERPNPMENPNPYNRPLPPAPKPLPKIPTYKQPLSTKEQQLIDALKIQSTPPAPVASVSNAPAYPAAPAVTRAVSAAERENIEKLASKITELDKNLVAISKGMPELIGSVSSGDAQSIVKGSVTKGGPLLIKIGSTLILLNSLKNRFKTLDGSSQEAKELAKQRLAPLLASSSFATSANILGQYSNNIPEPFRGKINEILNIVGRFQNQLGIQPAGAQPEEVLEAR